MDEIPEGRCGKEIETNIGKPWEIDRYCCFRLTWRSTGRCIWHADTWRKPPQELKRNRLSQPERLDEAILRGVRFTIAPNFSGCTLARADITDAELPNAKFEDAILQNADFSDSEMDSSVFIGADLSGTDFSGSKLWFSNFSSSNILRTDFDNADLTGSNMEEADINSPNFSSAELESCTFQGLNLIGLDFSNLNLQKSDFRDSNLSSVDFTGANISKVYFQNAHLYDTCLAEVDAEEGDFTNSTPTEADFSNSNLSHTDFTNADARGTVFKDSNLEDATFIRSELRDANLRDTRLYQTLFSDIRINSNTDFGEESAYEDPNTELGENYEDTSRWEAAAWVYRRLQDLHEENAMSEKARDYHVAKEEAHRAEYRENGEWFQWGVYTLNRYLTKHGESLKHVVAWSIGIIIACGLLFPFTGGIVTTNGTQQVTALSDLSLGLFARSFYYSMVTFTTLGYGDPAGTGAKLLVGLESLAGTLLIALFVFVLGRRVAQ